MAENPENPDDVLESLINLSNAYDEAGASSSRLSILQGLSNPERDLLDRIVVSPQEAAARALLNEVIVERSDGEIEMSFRRIPNTGASWASTPEFRFLMELRDGDPDRQVMGSTGYTTPKTYEELSRDLGSIMARAGYDRGEYQIELSSLNESEYSALVEALTRIPTLSTQDVDSPRAVAEAVFYTLNRDTSLQWFLGRIASGDGYDSRGFEYDRTMVQALLRLDGKYDGRLDGDWGPATERAVFEFGLENRLPENLSLDIDRILSHRDFRDPDYLDDIRSRLNLRGGVWLGDLTQSARDDSIRDITIDGLRILFSQEAAEEVLRERLLEGNLISNMQNVSHDDLYVIEQALERTGHFTRGGFMSNQAGAEDNFTSSVLGYFMNNIEDLSFQDRREILWFFGPEEVARELYGFGRGDYGNRDNIDINVAPPAIVNEEEILPNSDFGMRRHPVLGYETAHLGTDYAIYLRDLPHTGNAPAIVTHAGPNGNFGNEVVTQTSDRYGNPILIERRAHLDSLNVTTGDTVMPDDILGVSGDTGRVNGPHLHYETYLYHSDGNFYAVDPELLFSYNINDQGIRDALITMTAGMNADGELNPRMLREFRPHRRSIEPSYEDHILAWEELRPGTVEKSPYILDGQNDRYDFGGGIRAQAPGTPTGGLPFAHHAAMPDVENTIGAYGQVLGIQGDNTEAVLLSYADEHGLDGSFDIDTPQSWLGVLGHMRGQLCESSVIEHIANIDEGSDLRSAIQLVMDDFCTYTPGQRGFDLFNGNDDGQSVDFDALRQNFVDRLVEATGLGRNPVEEPEQAPPTPGSPTAP